MGEWTARAETISEEAAEYGTRAAQLCARCRRTGLDPNAYRGLSGAAVTLGGSPAATRAASPLADDHELARTLDTLETDLHDFAAELEHQRRTARDALTTAETELDEARADQASADTNQQRADAARRAREAQQLITDLEQALAILDPLDGRARHARQRIAAVPDELGGTYLEAYRLVTAGRRLPHEGRWLEASR